ncbi:hypothetical protein TYRP_001688 [Tyrophagus putrescentiae]|nr:hypothetical protein TYRP_001688 [Tyrophagus putrescentiae]
MGASEETTKEERMRAKGSLAVDRVRTTSETEASGEAQKRSEEREAKGATSTSGSALYRV